MKIAIVHDQLQEFGGAERVLVTLKNIFPDADVYTSFYSPDKLGIHQDQVKNWNIITSWGDKIGLFKRLYSPLRFLTPLIWEPFNFNQYDLVISSSGSYMCKGIVTRPETLHICYIHHPPRYLYYYETAIEWQKHLLIKIYGNLINHNLRMWDYLSSQRVDHFIANSEDTKSRVQKFYRRDAEVIYPPVEIPEKIEEKNQKLEDKKYYLTISRLAKAKHIDILVKAANKHKFNLKIVGVGRDYDYLKSIAGETVELLGSVTDKEFNELYKYAKAYLFASVDEEFGIAPIEAMGHGVPVIAYASGGLKETVHEGENGFLYSQLHEDSLINSIEKFEKLSDVEYHKMCTTARKEAEKYNFDVFQKKILAFVDSKLKSHARTT
jgi:glycosyltransferase involved in cell wall biosynthesis